MLERFFEDFDILINKIVKEFDEEYSASLNEKFSADIISNEISYAIAVKEESTDNFVKNFVERFSCAEKYNPFLLSILHEIGHLETIDEMVDDILERNSDTITDEEYFNLHNEKIATDWVGFWLEDNEELAKKYNTEIEKSLFKLYSLITD